MKDEQIIELYFERSEDAITKSREKYGSYCRKIAMNILDDALDSEECLNDTLLSAWRSIPPKRPENLATYLGKITRNLSINYYKKKTAQCRAANQFTVSLDELSECISFDGDIDNIENIKALGACINKFLYKQKELERKVFVCKYYYFDSITEIAERFHMSESRIKSLLHRMRKKLKVHLEKEGFSL